LRPKPLLEHYTLILLSRGGERMPWVLNRGDQRWQGMPSARTAANEPELLMRLALDCIGIVIIGDPFALPYLQRGELIEVLPDWQPPRVSAWAVFPGRRLMPARTRVLLDALIAKFSGEECRAEEEKVQTAKKRLRAAPPRTIAAKAAARGNDK
jgi:DNA-binding transcriptional LysR family regulator